MKNTKTRNSKKQNSKTRALRKQIWTKETWMDERTTVHSVEIGFPRIQRDRGYVQVTMDQIDNPPAVRRELRKHGAAMDRDVKKADDFVTDLLAYIPRDVGIISRVPGWRSRLFLLPGKVIGRSNRRYRLRQTDDAQSVIGVKSGTLDGWKAKVAQPAMGSSYISFGILTALAAPLQRFASLSEGVIFNLAGESSTGKSTAAKVAVTVAGAPEPLPSWNTTERKLHEKAAQFSDILLVLDDTEKRSGKIKQTARVLSETAHVMTDGQSQDYSDVVAGPDQLPKLYWRCMSISTSPVTAEAYAIKAGAPRSDGERVRFIDVPVPVRKNGGVADLLEVEPSSRIKAGKRLIKKLERATKKNHGTPLEPWIQYILSDVEPDTVDRLIRKFIVKVAPDGTGFDERIAAKFGLAFAAGKLATKAGLLPWPPGFSLKVVTHCYRQARTAILDVARIEADALEILQTALNDKNVFPRVEKRGIIPADAASSWVGIKRRIKEKKAVAISSKRLHLLTGSEESAKYLLEYIEREGPLFKGHGGKPSRQIPIRIEGKEEKPVSTRFYAVEYDWLIVQKV